MSSTAPLRDTYQFGLRHGIVLKVNSAQNAFCGSKGLIILHEGAVYPQLFKGSLRISFHKISAMVAENLRLDNVYAGQCCFDFLHAVQASFQNQ